MSTKPYKAIDCAFHDELEAAAIRRKKCSIHFLNQSDRKERYEGRILDFYIKDKIEYMVLEDDLVIRLDQIISLDNKINPSESSCGI